MCLTPNAIVEGTKMTYFVLVFSLMVTGLAPEPLAATSAQPSAEPVVAPEWIVAAGAIGRTICSLKMQGYGDKPGLKAVQLSCTGGTITAQAHQVLQQLWGSNLPKQGVVWTEDKKCRPVPGCLLTICGKSDAVFVNAQVSDIKTAPDTACYNTQGAIALCVSQSSRLTLRSCSFSSSTVTPLAAYDSATSVMLERCSTSKINMTLQSSESGVYLRRATVVVRSCSFTQNVAQNRLVSTITAAGDGRLAILDSTFKSNNAYCGGVLHAANTSQVFIQSSRFDGNNATWGGAICAEGQAKVNILPGDQLTVVHRTCAVGLCICMLPVVEPFSLPSA
jgi:hypothetical protein